MAAHEALHPLKRGRNLLKPDAATRCRRLVLGVQGTPQFRQERSPTVKYIGNVVRISGETAHSILGEPSLLHGVLHYVPELAHELLLHFYLDALGVYRHTKADPVDGLSKLRFMYTQIPTKNAPKE